MCGIVGYISIKKNQDYDNLIDEILVYQNRRGPDFNSKVSFQQSEVKISLGHNRLSIIDLASGANQPMSTDDELFVIVFNGEIYNYIEIRQTLISKGCKFKTQSDTEVILEAFRIWGEACFSMFFGMFAFAIYDKNSSRVFVVRDRFGVKPLYFVNTGSTFFFASSARNLASYFGKTPDFGYLTKGLLFKYYEDDGESSQYLSVKQVLPSTYFIVSWKSGKEIDIEQKKYYDIDIAVQDKVEQLRSVSYEKLRDELEKVIASACDLRLRSDVPVGISISGGLDSSSIACLISSKVPSLTAFSFSSPKVLESEGILVKKLSDNINLNTHFCWWTDSSVIEKSFWKTLDDQDAPFPSTSVMAQNEIFRIARQENIKVLLGGQGGDEAFMGYRKFFLFYLMQSFRSSKVNLIPLFFRDILPLLPPLVKRANIFFQERTRFTNKNYGMGTRLSLPIIMHDVNMGLEKQMTLKKRQILDVTKYSLPTLLRYEDRNSMGNSVESRLPFLDHRLIEFGIAINEEFKMRNGFGKWILRDLMKDKLIDDIRLNRDKRGFDVNQTYCITNGIGKLIRAYLTDNQNIVKQFLPAGCDVNTFFSDQELISNPQAFKEAVTLIWLMRN